MSKTAQQIFNELEAEKNAQASLAGLNSNSNMAIWRLLLWVVAFGHKLLYDAWDKTKAEIAVIASQQIIGTTSWYEGLALNWTGGSVTINVASCKESLSAKKVILKVATFDNLAQKLKNISAVDLNNLRSYINSKKIIGTDIDIISQSSDLLWMSFSIKYLGSLVTVESAVKTAIKDYLKNLPYGSDLSLSLLTNHLFSVPGVVDVNLTFCKVNTGFGYEVQPQNMVITDAGFFEIGTDALNNDLLNLNLYQ